MTGSKGIYKKNKKESRIDTLEKTLEEINVLELYAKCVNLIKTQHKENTNNNLEFLKELNKINKKLDYLCLPLWKRIFTKFN